MNIYERLRERRKELGLTMLEVANKTGVSEATISRWESGDIANMRRNKIVALAKALKVHPSFIMFDDYENYENEVSQIKQSNLLPLTVFNMEGVDGAHTINLNMDNFKEINDLITEVRDMPPEKIKAILQLIKTLK